MNNPYLFDIELTLKFATEDSTLLSFELLGHIARPRPGCAEQKDGLCPVLNQGEAATNGFKPYMIRLLV